jgi:hypothetical protein
MTSRRPQGRGTKSEKCVLRYLLIRIYISTYRGARVRKFGFIVCRPLNARENRSRQHRLYLFPDGRIHCAVAHDFGNLGVIGQSFGSVVSQIHEIEAIVRREVDARLKVAKVAALKALEESLMV